MHPTPPATRAETSRSLDPASVAKSSGANCAATRPILPIFAHVIFTPWMFGCGASRSSTSELRSMPPTMTGQL
jgi:hypothetical protein